MAFEPSAVVLDHLLRLHVNVLRTKQTCKRQDLHMQRAFYFHSLPPDVPTDLDSLTRPLLPLALVQPKCEGYAIAFPANKSPHLDYPFALHGPQAHGEPLPWRYEAVNDQTMNLISSGCTNVASPDYDSPRCPPCQGIGLHKRFPGVMECIQGAQKPNGPLRNYGIGGLIEKDRQKRACIDNLLFCLRQYESRPQH